MQEVKLFHRWMTHFSHAQKFFGEPMLPEMDWESKKKKKNSIYQRLKAVS